MNNNWTTKKLPRILGSNSCQYLGKILCKNSSCQDLGKIPAKILPRCFLAKILHRNLGKSLARSWQDLARNHGEILPGSCQKNWDWNKFGKTSWGFGKILARSCLRSNIFSVRVVTYNCSYAVRYIRVNNTDTSLMWSYLSHSDYKYFLSRTASNLSTNVSKNL